MKIQSLTGKNVCVLGYGKEGRATYLALKRFAPGAKLTIADSNQNLTSEPDTNLITGPDYLTRLDHFDAIIKTPGISWHPGGALESKVTSATQLFLDSLPEGTRVIGVTGTKGKSTTASLIYQALRAGGLRVFLAGNIGEPMLSLLPEATPDTTFVLELSSYQLETLHTSPHIAVVTSFFPDHLDYHGGLQAYLEAKKHITMFQHTQDVVFYNPSYPECIEIANLSPGKKIAFSPTDFPGTENPHVRGQQNVSNLAAAFKVALECGIDAQTATRTLETAKGLPHRQELLGEHLDVQWIDDSAANTPEATVAAIETLGNTVGTIIIGGLDRGYDLQDLATALAASAITHIVLFPETGPKVRDLIELQPRHSPKQYFETEDMMAAVKFAASHTKPGKAVLLSNGAPSYNLFKNFTERAAVFKEAIARLK